MPKPVGRAQRYMPGLDGLRALAVLAVIAYHLELGWAQGGLLGVGVFFTLSGYLITDLLLGQRDAVGHLRLGDFWLRRARRLLPALFLMVAVVVAWVTLFDRSHLPSLRGYVVAAAVYMSNWWNIVRHASYFSRFGPPPPLDHLWSLAVEEQFYLVWPFLLWLGLRYARGRYWMAGLTLAAAALSATVMALLYQPGVDPTRVYEGTDTRAFGLLVGAALAMVWPSRHLRADLTLRRRLLLDGAGVVGLVVIALLIWRTNQYSPFLYRGGIVLLSVATVGVVAALAHPASWLGPALGWAPLRWLGVRSYGIYLWHFPIIVLTTPTVQRKVNLPPEVLQVGATIAVAGLSWRFLEEPIRRGALGRFWARARSGGWRRGGLGGSAQRPGTGRRWPSRGDQPRRRRQRVVAAFRKCPRGDQALHTPRASCSAHQSSGTGNKVAEGCVTESCTSYPHFLSRRGVHRRLHVGRHGHAQLLARSGPTPERAVRTGRRHLPVHRDLRGEVDHRDAIWSGQCLRCSPSAGSKWLPGV